MHRTSTAPVDDSAHTSTTPAVASTPSPRQTKGQTRRSFSKAVHEWNSSSFRAQHRFLSGVPGFRTRWRSFSLGRAVACPRAKAYYRENSKNRTRKYYGIARSTSEARRVQAVIRCVEASLVKISLRQRTEDHDERHGVSSKCAKNIVTLL